ncbi:MAG TPA: carboxypeptidase-like regulatory domain-containing protein [Bryobacteraceae bacterium]|nr:carboxypeptidase-like regulatory domain-containing protein [Bryobacteraceae bacterium]
MRYVVMAFFACASVSAQTPPTPARAPRTSGASTNPGDAPPATVNPEDKCSIEGTVVNGITGEALKKAHLSLRALTTANGTAQGAMTDGAGHFLIDDIDPGRYNFIASRNGYVTQGYSPQGNSRNVSTITLQNGQHLKEVTFKMTPQGVIAGRVLDEDGEPMASVRIQCMVYRYQNGRKQLSSANGNSTNDLGEFRVYGLSPGKYILNATYHSPDLYSGTLERTSASTQTVEEGYAPTYYPNATNAESATQIEITPGAVIQGINMSLARVRTVRIKGHVTGIAPNSRRGISVMLLPRDGEAYMPRAMARGLDSQGNFEMRGVTPGSYYLRADYANEGARFSARQQIEVGNSKIEGIELVLQPPAELSGSVKIEENGDLKDATLRVMLQPRATGPMMGGGNAQVKDDLTFKLTNITTEPYDVNVYGLPQGFYVKSVRIGDQDVTETGVDFSQGVPAAELKVTINPNGGQIDGTVQNANGENAAGATVTLIPDSSHRSLAWLYRVANTDQNGHFTMKSIRPGQYKIIAWEDIEAGAYMDPDYIKPHESAGKDMSVAGADSQTVQLAAVPAEKSTAAK